MIHKLRQLYDNAFSVSIGAMNSTSFSNSELPTNPMLINPPADYRTADKKVMIFGKETNDWDGQFPLPGGVPQLLKGYREFCVEGGNWKYGGQYWNGVKQFKQTIEAKFKERGITTSFVYNNVIKIGKAWDKGTPSENILEWESHWFTVIGGEVEIMKPDIILFFSGPDYDQYIARAFGSFETEKIGNWNTRQLARIASDRLPSATIRTYHPNYLWRNGFPDYLKAISKAIDC